ncbi:hypothetical protein M422DRAFT_61877 [Sphaerobolus stellatus SS14]|uniref:Glycerol kinase n=1 Tax=Sphaerobolus stellatus (strain SS14) TaxID=990650 RepID=A0A0C9THL5_SPHS4|nr:hypothetical protein M422DRAFT_61877 [Sphaerobolus stellatus SS14]
MNEYFSNYYLGTGSVRATLIRQDGQILASSTQPTSTWRDKSDHRIFEQSTTEIWKEIGKAVRTCLADAKVEPPAVKGLGFDATCSLAVSDEHGQPVILAKGKEIGKNGERNIILWADHRAEKEAEVINKSGSIALNYVGGIMNLEMEVPKVLWLKNNRPSELFARCQFFDLPDYHSTTLPPNSLHLNPESPAADPNPPIGCQPAFFNAIGLHSGHSQRTHDDAIAEGRSIRYFSVLIHYAIIPKEKRGILTAGLPVGRGLSKKAAEDYAGWIGAIAARFRTGVNDDQVSEPAKQEEAIYRLAAVAGTSTCHLIQTPKGHFVPGVWGPYQNAIFSGWWMNEAGQSSTGQLIDFVISTHPARETLEKATSERGISTFEILEEELERLRQQEAVPSLAELTKHIHFYPDLHGNRSPITDPKMTGSITGLTLDDSISDLAKKFNVTLEMNVHGHDIHGIYMSGVVLGSAMLGRFAAEGSALGQKPSDEEQRHRLWNIMLRLAQKKLLEVKYKIFRETIEIQKHWQKEVEDALRED